MRFALHISCMMLSVAIGLQTAYAQNKPKLEASPTDYSDLTQPLSAPPARLQKGQRVDKLETLDGLIIKRFARRLGAITAISRGPEGQLYTVDRKSGRVFIIPDGDQDGRAEQIRPLPYRFNAPSAVLSLGENLYVADQDAIWQIPQGRFSNQGPLRLANLKNTNSTGRYFLTAHQTATDNSANLRLGYSTQNGTARLISVDVKTGQAALIDETDGELRQLVMSSTGKPWIAYRNKDGLHIGLNFDTATALGQTVTLNGLALPQNNLASDKIPDDNKPDGLAASLRDHIFISRNDPIDVIAAPTSLGSILPRGRTVFSGFQNGRTAWGRAGALHLDARGLFVADPYNGDLWLVKRKPLNTRSPENPMKGIVSLKAVRAQQESALKRDPLEGIYDSLFPDPNAPKDTAQDDVKSDRKGDDETISPPPLDKNK